MGDADVGHETGSAVVGSDVGGTFTDLVMIDGRGAVSVAKVPTTPDDPARAVLEGVDALGRGDGGPGLELARFVHATTLVANTLIERTGDRTALLVTHGFRDVLRLARHSRVATFDLDLDPPEPLVPGRLTFTVRERILASGKVLEPLNEAEVAALVQQIVGAGVDAVAVCLLHSYVNPAHEEAVLRLFEEHAPTLRVCVSSRVLRQAGEYERAVTTVANAYCATRLRSYISGLDAAVASRGGGGRLAIMTSAGGLVASEVAVSAPVRIVESGPAAGASYVAHLARSLDLARVIAFDMGGTTAKGCLIENGQLLLGEEIEVARAEGFRPGSGMPLRTPSVSFIEMGAGGGSIAWRDAVGVVRVGPRSAGAVPGPACCRRGGAAPTVTDADLVLGYLGATSFLDGTMPLGDTEAWRALASLAPSGDDGAVEIATLVHDVVVENMAAAILRHVIERGGDPRESTMVAFGGAGPVHAYRLAQRLGVSRVLVPPLAGVLSAVGLVVAEPSYQMVRTLHLDVTTVEPGELAEAAGELTAEVAEALSAFAPDAPVRFRTYAQCAYAGQSSTLNVSLRPERGFDRQAIHAGFLSAYRAAYGYAHDDLPIQIVSLMVEGMISEGAVTFPSDHRRRRGSVPPHRAMWSASLGRFIDAAVLWRQDLQLGTVHDGPVVVEEPESTTVVDAGGQVEIDRLGNLVITVGAG